MLLSSIKYDKVVLHEVEDIILEGGAIDMREFEKIRDKMRERRITPRIHYELIAIRALKVAAAVLIGAGIVWLVAK